MDMILRSQRRRREGLFARLGLSKDPDPDTTWDEGFIFNRYGALVAKYLPMISKRTGIALGPVSVRWLEGRKKHGSGMVFLAEYFNHRDPAEIGVYKLFPRDMDERRAYLSGQTVDEVVLHELTHHLGSYLSGPDKGEIPEVWREGFAMYGEFAWFSDFLPAGKNLTRPADRGKISFEGLKRVAALVRSRGQGILYEIPREWRKFEKELRVTAPHLPERARPSFSPGLFRDLAQSPLR